MRWKEHRWIVVFLKSKKREKLAIKREYFERTSTNLHDYIVNIGMPYVYIGNDQLTIVIINLYNYYKLFRHVSDTIENKL